MKHRTTSLLIMLIFALTTLHSANIDTNTRIFNSNFKTLQVHLAGNEFFPPIITLNSPDILEISFDELSNDMRYMRYKLLHCNADWSPSDLVESEYLDGFNYANIDDYKYSSGTFANYVNYRFDIPNTNMSILKSGNYLVQVYPEDDEDDIILQARFYVNEGIMNVVPSVTSRTDIDYNKEHQQVSVDVSSKNQKLRNWYNDIQLYVTQNSRTDNEIIVKRPQLIESSTISYQHDKSLIFPAGNEFRRFEVVSTTYAGMHVSNIVHYNPYYHVTLFDDEPRTYAPYLYDQTQFGRFKIRQSDVNNIDNNTEYVIVHFSLDYPFRNNGDFYVDGGFTNHLFTDSNKMHYNTETNKYELDMMLKMGSYNYQYLWLPKGQYTATSSVIEGNHYQTVNEYLARLYYRAPGDRYDRLVGFGLGYSGK